MDFAANAVSELIAPAPMPAAQATTQAGDGGRFQDHLDTDAIAHATPADRAASGKPATKQTKPPSAAAGQGDASADEPSGDDDATQIADASQARSDPAHAVMLQVLPEVAATTPTPSTPTTATQPAAPPANQAATPKQPVALVVQSPALQSAPPAQTKLSPEQTQTPPNAVAPQPGKAETKTDKAEHGAPQAATPPPATAPAEPPPTTVVAPPAVASPQTGAINTAAPPDQAAIGAIRADSPKRAPVPSPARGPQPPASAPPATRDGDTAAKSETAGKSTGGATGAKSAAGAARAPDFKDFVRVAAGHGESSPTRAAAPPTAPPIMQAATRVDLNDLAAARAAAPVASQVAREIVRRANGDTTRFELRLDPPELGKIQVRLDVTRDHKVTAVVSADNPQALSELSRGARDLQQALQSAGLDLADDGLSFDLSNSQNGFSQPDQSNANSGNASAERRQAAPNQSSADTSTPRARPLSIESWRGSRVDVMA